jgi:hypothetical protein
MTRANGFTQADVRAREEIKNDPNLIEMLVVRAGGRDLQTDRFAEELDLALRVFKLKELGVWQERPANIISTLRKGLTLTDQLLKWLRSLPWRHDLKTAGTEELLAELVTNINGQINRYKKRVARHRPVGAAELRLSLRKNLGEIHQKYCPEKNDRERGAWIAHVFARNEIPFPNEKKDRKRFRSGYRRQS